MTRSERFLFSMDSFAPDCKMTDKLNENVTYVSRDEATLIISALETYLRITNPKGPEDEEITEDLGPVSIEE